MVAGALLRYCVSIEERLAATTFLKERNSALRKKLFSEINYSHIQEKMLFYEQRVYFGSSLHSLLL